jgi:hypothetical protein
MELGMIAMFEFSTTRNHNAVRLFPLRLLHVISHGDKIPTVCGKGQLGGSRIRRQLRAGTVHDLQSRSLRSK